MFVSAVIFQVNSGKSWFRLFSVAAQKGLGTGVKLRHIGDNNMTLQAQLGSFLSESFFSKYSTFFSPSIFSCLFFQILES